MDPFLIGIITFFALLIGGLIYYGYTPARPGLQSLQLNVSPEEVIEMQLDGILESKDAASPNGHSFKFAFAEKKAYEELKTNADGKPLQSALLKRCIDCLQSTMTFDNRVKIVYESYNNMVPRDVLQYLGGVKTELTNEIEAVKTEANLLKDGWGQTIFNQAMDLTVGLQRRKEARAQAEEQKVQEKLNAEKQKILDAKKAEEAKRKAERDADRAYQSLVGEPAPKKVENGSSSKKKEETNNKSTSQKKDGKK